MSPRLGSRDGERLGVVGLGDTCAEGNNTQGWAESEAPSAPLAPPPQPGPP